MEMEILMKEDLPMVRDKEREKWYLPEQDKNITDSLEMIRSMVWEK